MRAPSSWGFMFLTLPFIHSLSYLSKRLTNPTSVFGVIVALKKKYYLEKRTNKN
jgi:hypothetical protein